MTKRRPSGRNSSLPQLDRAEIKAMFQGLEYLDENRPAQSSSELLQRLAPPQRAQVTHWMGVLGNSDPGLARLFCQRAPQALRLLDERGIEAWLLQALEQFDRRGLGWAVQTIDAVADFAATRKQQQQSLTLAEVATVLQRVAAGLGGRELRIAEADRIYTDTDKVYLPGRLALTAAGDRTAAFRLYKSMLVHHWAQTWYGTWQAKIVDQLLAEPATVVAAFATVERWRLDHSVGRDLPGAGRDMRLLIATDGDAATPPEGWREAAIAVADRNATAEHSLRWAARLGDREPPPPAPYHGEFRPHEVEQILMTRLQRDRSRLAKALGQLRQELNDRQEPNQGQRRMERRRKPTEGFSLASVPAAGATPSRLSLLFDQRPVTPPAEFDGIVQSILQDMGDVPEDYFRPGGQKPYDATQAGRTAPLPSNVAAAYADTGACYPEWDYTRQRFRPDYCLVREVSVDPGDEEFVSETLKKYAGLAASIRRAFEALRGADRRERRQYDGDDIDLDALVDARADNCRGGEMPQSIYTRLRSTDRSIAVMIAVDMSGSTKGWVIDAERESLVLLSEALETVGDRYALNGFSGRTHQRVEVYPIKGFQESFSKRVKRRVAGIRPHAYTRMGAALRHLGAQLNEEPARHKLLVTLSDGRPEDYGSYYGRYGVEDTRHALLELRQLGIHPFCITLDREGGDYLPYMYGPANYACIDDVAKLPYRVADIYRRLTS